MTAEAAYGAALALAAAVAPASAKEDRVSLILCSCLLFISWLLYNAPWHGWGIRVALHRKISLSEGWSVGDAMIAALVLAVYNLYGRRWVILIFAMLLGQIACYQALDQFGEGSWLAIQGVLDILFVAMVAILLTVGGRGVGNLVHRGFWLRGIRLFRGQD